MSLDILPNISKEGVSKKGASVGNAKIETAEKKEGGSLFDSLMKDIQKDKQNITKDDTEQNNNSAKSNKQSKTQLENQTTPTTKTATDGKEVTSETSKKVSQSLVELVVDEVKSKKEAQLVKSSDTENKELKTKIDEKVTTIKIATDDIKSEISKIDSSKIDSSKVEAKDTEKSDKVNKTKVDTAETKEQDSIKNNLGKIEQPSNQEIKTKIDEKVTTIKIATDDIKNQISKIDSAKIEDAEQSDKVNKTKIDTADIKEQDSIKNNLGKIEQPSNQEIKTKIDEKITTIKIAADDIKSEISKIDSSKVEPKDIKQSGEADKVKTENTPIDKLSTNEEIKIKIDSKIATIDKAITDIKTEVSNLYSGSENKSETKQTTSNMINQNQLTATKEGLKSDKVLDGKSALLANGFLNSQQANKQNISLAQLANAKDTIEKNKTLDSVKKSATMLELNMEEIGVEQTEQKGEKSLEISNKNQKDSQLFMMQNRALGRFLIDKENVAQDTQQMKNLQEVEKVTQQDIATKEKNVVINVPQNVVETIQSKIVGAHQKVGSFMSEVARNMYLNYKPPFTSFRVSLNPANLGSIAVVMRASKTDNSVTVSMNMSNNSTMEVFAENKTALQTALQKQLGESSNITLNFGSGDGSTNEQSNQSNQNNDSSEQSKQYSSQEESLDNIIEEENSKTLEYL